MPTRPLDLASAGSLGFRGTPGSLRGLPWEHVFVYRDSVLSLVEVEILRRSLAMSPTLPPDQVLRLLDTVAELLARECCRPGHEEAGG